MVYIYLFFMSLSYNIDPRLTFSIVKTESNYNVKAVGDRGKSFGLFQIKCSTANNLGHRGSCKSLLDPYKNINYGLMYLDQKLNKHNSTDAISAYNAGRPFLCKDYKKKCKKRPRVYVNNKYVHKVMNNLVSMNNFDLLVKE